VAKGRSNRQIAAELHISDRTAENHVRNIMAVLDVGSRVQSPRGSPGRAMDKCEDR